MKLYNDDGTVTKTYVVLHAIGINLLTSVCTAGFVLGILYLLDAMVLNSVIAVVGSAIILFVYYTVKDIWWPLS